MRISDWSSDGALPILNSPAFYIGALGSRKTHAARLERLGAAGFTDKELARIHGPAWLPIGAAGPAEIAVSILAEMTTVLRRSEEHTSELQSLMRISYAVFCLKKKKHNNRESMKSSSEPLQH